MLLHSVPFSFSLREMCSNIWESPPVQREAGITGDTRGRQRGASASCIEKASTVSALTENGFTLQVDGNTVMECDSFLERFMALIGAIYCYNLVYPKQIKKTMVFIENMILGIKDEQGIDRKIISGVAAVKRANQE